MCFREKKNISAFSRARYLSVAGIQNWKSTRSMSLAYSPRPSHVLLTLGCLGRPSVGVLNIQAESVIESLGLKS